MSKEEMVNELRKAVINGEFERITNVCQTALTKGLAAKEIVNELSLGMVEAAKLYQKKGMYLDAIFSSAAAFQFAAMFMQSQLEKERKEVKARVVLAVPDGPWTLGKDIVRTTLLAADFDVVDAGSDVPADDIVKCVKENNATILGIGLYLSYRIHMVEEIIKRLIEEGLRYKVKTILSGPAGTKAIAEKTGFDAAAKDAVEVVEVADRFVEERQKEQTGRNRVLTALKLKEPDRVPLVPFSMTFSARVAGIKYKDFCQSGEAMASSHIKAAKVFGWDAITCACSDVGRMAEPVGAKVYYPEDDVPRLTEGVLHRESAKSDFEKLGSPEEYIKVGRNLESINAIRILKEEFKDEVAIIGWTEGPFQGTALLFGADPLFLFLLKYEPELVKKILEWYLQYEFLLAKEFVQNGADIICLSEPVGYFMSPEFFKEWVYENEKKFCERVNKELNTPVIFHCCGNVPQCIHLAPEVNPSNGGINFDYQVPLKWAKKLIGGRITIMGNLDCNNVLHLGSPDDVKKAAEKAIKDAAAGGGYWLSGGCEIPKEMPYENMYMLRKVCETTGRYQQ